MTEYVDTGEGCSPEVRGWLAAKLRHLADGIESGEVAVGRIVYEPDVSLVHLVSGEVVKQATNGYEDLTLAYNDSRLSRMEDVRP